MLIPSVDPPGARGTTRIAIAGATGFVGRHLGPLLRGGHHVVGLTRLPEEAPDRIVDEWRHCDVLSLRDTEQALEGIDCAYYLVHSMMPSARLHRGRFWDLDLIAADNFARAAAIAGVQQVIYLGGIVPGRAALSRHLASRREVENVLRSGRVPVTTLRAGLVIGAGGASFLALTRTIERLPVLVCPPWADTLTHPIALRDAVELLRFCLGRRETFGQTYDIGGPQLMSYRAMMAEIARQLGKRRPHLTCPVAHTRFLQLCVSIVTGAPRELVQPLIESLRYPIVARERSLNALAGLSGTPFRVAVQDAIAEFRAGHERRATVPIAFQAPRSRSAQGSVRWVERFPLPPGKTAEWFAREYLSWLPRGLTPFLVVDTQNDQVFNIAIRGLRRRPLLVLERAIERSSPDRWLFFIRGGLLAEATPRGRLEFREVLGGRYVLAAIMDYRPRLPWPVYLQTQTRLHRWVMRSFRAYVAGQADRAGASADRDLRAGRLG